jgi:hypothetical protein
VNEPSLARRLSEYQDQNRSVGELVTLTDWLDRFRDQLPRILKPKGAIYAVVANTFTLTREYTRDGSKRTFYLESDCWQPIHVVRTAETGTLINRVEERFEPYFRSLSGWTQTFSLPPENDHRDPHRLIAKLERLHDNAAIRPQLSPIAVNRENAPLAAKVTYDIHPYEGQGSNGRGRWSTHAEDTSGPLYLFPALPRVPDEEAMRILLEIVISYQSKTPPPAWAETMEAPGENAARVALEKAQHEADFANEQLARASEQLSRLQRFKALLYDTGHPLEELVRETFDVMGVETADVPDRTISDEFLLVSDPKILVEVKGVGRSVGHGDLSQLMTSKAAYLARIGENVKALLVGNAFRQLPPSERNTKDKPNFPDNVLTPAEEQNICLLSTVDLFKAFSLVHKGAIDGKELIRLIQATRGVLRFED